MTVSSGWNSREVSLNGRLIGVTCSTPGRPARRLDQLGLARPDSPTTAMTTRSAPWWSYGVMPSARIWLFTPEDLGLAGGPGHHDEHRRRRSFLLGQTKKQRSEPLLYPARPVLPGPRIRGRSCRASKVEVGFICVSRTVPTRRARVSTRVAPSARGSGVRPPAARPGPMISSTTSRLRVGVVLDVLPVPGRELALRPLVQVAIVVVGPQPVAEADHPLELGAAGREDVEVDVRVRAP